MKYILFLLLSMQVSASEYQFDFGRGKVQHAWRGPDNRATFNPIIDFTGLTYISDSGFAVRAGYGVVNDSTTSGRFSDLKLKIGYVASLELMYRYSVNNLTLYSGIGTYRIPTPLESRTSDLKVQDSDNDEGYFVGAEYEVYTNVSLGYKFNMLSRIKSDPYDEWTRSHSLYFAFKF